MAGTRWVRLDVDYFTNPKCVKVGPSGRQLHLASICWVGQHLTDGHIPGDVVPTLCRLAGVNHKSVDKLIAAGLWERTEQDFYVKDYLEMNTSRADTEREREMWRQRQRRFRDRQEP